MQENLKEMIENLNDGITPLPIDPEEIEKLSVESEEEKIEVVEEVKEESAPEEVTNTEIKLMNFYNWYETYESIINTVARVRTEVANVDSKDSIIFKIRKGKEEEDMELVSFYNPSIRPIISLPPIYLKIFKNDTFLSLHQYSDDILIKCYGVKNGLIVSFCVNIDGMVIPYRKVKVKRNAESIEYLNDAPDIETIKLELAKEPDLEMILLLYKQAIKVKDEFTTKENSITWFLKKQNEVIDINHILKIDNVLINIIKG